MGVAVEDYRGRLRAVLDGHLAEITDEQVWALSTATETMAQLIDVLQTRPARLATDSSYERNWGLSGPEVRCM